MKQILRGTLLSFGFACTMQAYAVDFSAGLDYDGLFDNREYKNDMLPQTIYGMRLMPELRVSDGSHSLTGGVSGIWEFGASSQPDPDVILYYGYNGEKWSSMFGSIPRTRLQRQLPDCMLYDSIAFFEPTVKGTVIQYSGSMLQAEFYCNWFSRQTQTQREAFRLVSDGFAGRDGAFLSGGWFIALTHFAKPKERGHYIYEQLQANPYVRLDFRNMLPDCLSLQARVGLMANIQRLRAHDYWDTPMGVLAGLEASWKSLKLHSTVYSGKPLLPYLNDSEAGMKFHRSDPFYNHTFFCRAGLEYTFITDSAVNFSFCWDVNFTPDSPVHNRQLIKLTYDFDFK